MKKVLFVLLVAVGVCFGQVFNWVPQRDTITDFAADSTKYTKAFDLSRYENTVMVVTVNDSDAAGFASDSVNLRYLYQIGYPWVYNTTGGNDTLWWPAGGVVMDTLNGLDSAGTSTEGTLGSDGTITTALGDVDTSFISGFMSQAVPVSPDWGPMIRFKFEGLTGNNKSSLLELYVTLQRRPHSLSR